MNISVTDNSALIVVDVQNDFCPGGALPVREGDKVVPILDVYIQRFKERGLAVYFTRDWHPENHMSFKLQGGIWPPHCVQNTSGARFHPDLLIPSDAIIISKGIDPDRDAYSGFQGTDLYSLLKERDIRRLFIGGLATDYCVKSTVLDGLKSGFEVIFLADASRGVDVKPGDSQRAIEDMLREGAIKITLRDIIYREIIPPPPL